MSDTATTRKCIYRRIKLPYTVGLGKIYTSEDIARARESPSFEREYNLQYLGQTGNVFNQLDIDRAVRQGAEVDYLHPRVGGDLVMALDPGFGSSKFGILISQLGRKWIEVIYAEEIENTRPTRILEVAVELYHQYGVNTIYSDASNPGIISDLKEKLGEDFRKESWENDLRRAKKLGISPRDYMKVVPILFTRESGAEMITHAQKLVTDGYVAIPEHFRDLIVQMRMATAIEGRLDKSQYSLDLMDCFRMAVSHYNIKNSKS